MSQKILIGVIIVLALLGAGVFIATNLSEEAATLNEVQNNSFQASLDATNEQLGQSPVPGVALIQSISGSIQKIDGDKLTVKINSMGSSAGLNLSTRIITVNSATKIILFAQRDRAQFQKKMQDFRNKMAKLQEKAGSGQVQTSLVPPKPLFDKKNISLANLKINQQISAMAGEDIGDKKEFTAIQIEAQEALAIMP